MNRFLPWTRANSRFQAKVLIPVVTVMVLFMAATLWLVNGRIQTQLQKTTKSALATTENLFTKTFQDRAESLMQQFSSIPNQAKYYAVARKFNDSPADLKVGSATMVDTFNELLQGTGKDLAFVLFTGARGQLLAAETNRNAGLNAEQFYSACAPIIKAALDSSPPVTTAVRTLQFAGRLFTVVIAPSFDNLGNLVGAVGFGLPLDDAVMRRLKLPDTQIALIANDQVVASTLSSVALQTDLLRDYQELTAAPDEVMEIGNQHYVGLTGFLPLSSPGASMGYLLLLSYEKTAQEFRAAQRLLVLVSLLGIIIGTTAVWLVVRRATQPLRQLRDSAEAVGRGDFSKRIEIASNDELGELAAVFNHMTENLQKSLIQLEKTVETLRATQAQLLQSEKLSAVGEFVAGVAHELNNPLTALIGFSELLQTDDVDEDTRSSLKRISSSAERCHKIVQSLLSFARQHPPERKVTNINGLVDSVIEILLYELRTNNIKVVKELSPHLPRLLVDPHQLQQVFLNVVNNARQAIEACHRAGAIRIITRMADKRVQVRFQDDGPGISEENIAKIFNPFFTTKPIGKGTGLGLSLSYGIIREHGGVISVESKLGHGTTFIIDLPVTSDAEAEPDQNGARPAALPHDGKGKHLLLVDDEEDILDLLRATLEGCGYHAQTASDGEKALRLLAQRPFDLIICDWKMPGLSGQQLYQCLLQSHPEAAKRMIFMTGDMLSETTERFLREQGKTCLAKPFTLAEVQATLSRIFQN
jgi:two-component system, NtrC family, sensor kinase